MNKPSQSPAVVDMAVARRERERARYAERVMEEVLRQEHADRRAVQDRRQDAHFKAKDRF